MNYKLYLHSIIYCLLSLTPLAVNAMPTVSGNTISWPENGWYQVQRSTDYTTVCEGRVSAQANGAGGPCTVDAGTYIVINHTTRERVENVVVTNAELSVSVQGNTISWPNDGWYQVQKYGTFESICEGTQACQVDDGTYLVVNHTTGERYENVRVGDADTSNPVSPKTVTVEGRTLSWPNDGWYQVQESSTYENVCEGVRSCDVSPGQYIVINHTTDVRTTITVAGDTTPTNGEVSVDFSIEVPAYVSDALQVTVSYAGREIKAQWLTDESWFVSDTITLYAVEPMEVTFSDDNGGITLGVYTGVITSILDPVTITVSPGQFVTDTLDDDLDGISNLDELKNGTNPYQFDEAPADKVTEPDLVGESQALLWGMAGYQLDQLATLVADVAFIVGQQTTIVWPNTDYYQVSTVETPVWPNSIEFGFVPEVYGTVCEGGRECQVVPGNYLVVNHTTGARQYLEVPQTDPEDQANVTQLADASYPYADPYPDVPDINATITRFQYACEHGGTMILEIIERTSIDRFDDSISPNGFSIGVVRGENYRFDQCRMTVRDRFLPDDTYTLQGDLLAPSLYRLGDNTSYYTFDGFTLTSESGVSYIAHADIADVDGYDGQYVREADITLYARLTPDADFDEILDDVSFGYYSSADYPVRLLDITGSIANESTHYQSVFVRTPPAVNGPCDDRYFVTCELTFSTDAGAVLKLNEPFLEDVERYYQAHYTDSSGEQMPPFVLNFSTYFSEYFTQCVPQQQSDEGHEQLNSWYCPDGYYRNLNGRTFTLP